MKLKIHVILVFLQLCFSQSSISQIAIDSIHLQKTYYTDSSQQYLYFPLGNMSFADSIVLYTPGIPSPQSEFRQVSNALGEPDFNFYKDNSYVSLGCKGQLILKFIDNGFIDVPGEDLMFFEIGPSAESFKIEISTDAKDWIYIGVLPGGTSSIDIARSQRVRLEKNVYHYVRITDLGDFCDGPTPGADIDAVGAFGGVLKFNLSASLLFDRDVHLLKTQAKNMLNKLAELLNQIASAEVLIEGHTDSDANASYNLSLGHKRAKSVKTYLRDVLHSKEQVQNIRIQTKSYGKSRPIGDNRTEEGKQKNRRVEISIIPVQSFFEQK